VANEMCEGVCGGEKKSLCAACAGPSVMTVFIYKKLKVWKLLEILINITVESIS
jgi:hypothetical protein